YILYDKKSDKKVFYNKNDKKSYPVALSPDWVKDDNGLIYKLSSTGSIDKAIGGYSNIEKSDNFLIVSQNNKKGLLSLSGQEILAPVYDDIVLGNNNSVLIKKEGKYGIANSNGNIIVEPVYPHLSAENGYIIVTSSDNHKGLLSSTGKEIIAPVYDDLKAWPNNLILLSKNGKYGIASAKGNVLLEPLYSNISKNGDLLTLTGSDNAKSIYDLAKERTVLTGFDEIGNILYSTSTNAFYPLKKNGKWGIINKNYQIVIPCQYNDIWARTKTSDNNYAYIKNSAGTGLVKFNSDNTAKIVVNPGIFDSFYTAYESNYIIGVKNKSLGAYCKKNGAIIKPGQGGDYLTYAGGIIFAPAKPKWGMVNAFTSTGDYLGSANITNEAQLRRWLQQMTPKLK
ncbi:MAG: WG repeat-containing protein, partial [Muribaculaceae bacterium]|nr:WG repeat-containing protein [Muribaculaceae bacterium]